MLITLQHTFTKLRFLLLLLLPYDIFYYFVYFNYFELSAYIFVHFCVSALSLSAWLSDRPSVCLSFRLCVRSYVCQYVSVCVCVCVLASGGELAGFVVHSSRDSMRHRKWCLTLTCSI